MKLCFYHLIDNTFHLVLYSLLLSIILQNVSGSGLFDDIVTPRPRPKTTPRNSAGSLTTPWITLISSIVTIVKIRNSFTTWNKF
ncbi:unnamed protein product [Schistosoma turkestanicum]|nr:unnamed protein product [Schistosoma turkestanicum]